MRKILRINTEMRYINNRQQFTIAELMVEFEASRSTIIRDLDEIQELGLPLYATPGHNGGYKVLRNQTLPAVAFTTTEVQALFVAFLATKNSQLPYLQNRRAITEKLLAVMSAPQQDELRALSHLLWFENSNPDNPDLLELTDTAPLILGDLLSMVVRQPQLRLEYRKPNAEQNEWRDVHILHLFNRQQVWYVEAFDLLRRAKRTFRIDRIVSLAPTERAILPMATIIEETRLNTPQPNVILKLRGTSLLRFKQAHRPGMRLQYLDPFQQEARVEDHAALTPAVAKLYADWLMGLGEDIEVVALPEEIRAAVRTKMEWWKRI